MAIDFKYEIKEGLDRIFDERGNTILAMRRVAWGEGEAKLELRKWMLKGEEETPNKGFSFLTEDGPNELAHVLVEEGYGDTSHILSTLKDRDDFDKAVSHTLGKDSDLLEGREVEEDDDEETFYDPKNLALDLGDEGVA